MNKSVFSVLLVAMLGICSLNAGETMAQKPTTSLQKQDMEMLFGANANSVNVAVLSEEELKETQGEVAPALIYIGGAIAGGALAAAGEDIYKGIKRIFGW